MRLRPIFIGMFVFGFIFLLYFGAIYIANSQELAAYGDLDKWKSAQAEVIDAYVAYNGENMVYQDLLDYNYTVNSVVYNGTVIIRIDFDTNESAQAYLDSNYHIGDAITIYHHPTNVGFSTLDPKSELAFKENSLRFTRYVTIVALAMVSVSAIGFIVITIQNKRNPPPVNET